MDPINLIGTATLVLALPLGIATGLLRNRRSLPAIVRLAPLILVCAVVAIYLPVPAVSLFSLLTVPGDADAAAKATLLARVTSELINCTLAAGIVAFAYVTGLIPTLLVINRPKRNRPPPRD